MGVKFVSPKNGDSVAVVARSVEAREDELEEELAAAAADGPLEPGSAPEANVDADATIEAADAAGAAEIATTRRSKDV